MSVLSTLEAAVAFARGVPGVMLPTPEAAGPEHAIALLHFAGQIIDVIPCPSCHSPVRIDKLEYCSSCITETICRRCRRYGGLCRECAAQ